MRPKALTILLLLLALPAFAAETPTMICKNGIVSAKDAMPEVLSKCGEPALKAQRSEARLVQSWEQYGKKERTIATTVTIDEWTYNFGPNEFLHLVTFESGRVTRIESLGYGY